MENFINIIYAILVLGLGTVFLSMEYYARKARVCAAPSVPWMRKAVLNTLKREMAKKDFSKNPPVILELGSGWGTLALDAAKEFPEAKITGYEISPAPLFVSRLRAFFGGHKNTKFLNRDFYKEDFSNADFILTYLTEPLMENLRPKFEKELKKSCVVICNTFKIPGWKPANEETIQNFIYELKVYTYKDFG